MSIFKAYDIRGIYGQELSLDIAQRIGRCLPRVVPAKRVLVGRDARVSSPPLRDALCRGLTEAGCDVDDMGLATTPMVYCFTARHHYDLSIQITASHNPAEYNGFKISRSGASPVGYDTGLDALEREVQAGALPPAAATAGKRRTVDLLDEFLAFLAPWRPDLGGLNLAVDCSDGMAALVARPLLGPAPRYLADTPDGSFPSHTPNPLEAAGRGPLTACVLANHLDAGVIFDADADRVMFIDERGTFIRPDVMIAVMAGRLLREHPGATVLQDIRTSRGVTEHLHRLGARTAMWKVGHAFAKLKMRELNAVFGGELAGHYYFRDFFWCDSGELAALVALGELAAAHRQGLRFTDLVAPIDRYANTGELNFRITRKREALDLVKNAVIARQAPAAILDFDGYRIDYPEWWMSIRLSNTEPYLRLILEAANADLLQTQRARIEALLAPFIDQPVPNPC